MNGGPDLLEHLRRRYADDADVFVEEVECIAACDLAPVLQVNYEFHGPLTADAADDLVDEYKRGALHGPHDLRHAAVSGSSADGAERRASSPSSCASAPTTRGRIDAALAQRRVRRRSTRRSTMAPEDDRRRGHDVGPARPRRRRLRHRPEVVVPAEGRVPALPRGQRRRGRAVHVQGPHARRARPAPAHRGRRSSPSYAIQAHHAFIYLRGEFALGAERLAAGARRRVRDGLRRQEHPRLRLRPRDRPAPRRRLLHRR